MNTQGIISKKIFFLLGFLTILFLILSIIYTPAIDEVLPADPFFYAKNLSIFYWLSLSSLLTLLFLRFLASLKARTKKFIDIFLICALALLIYGTSCFAYIQPVYVDTYINTSASLKILERGYTPQSLSVMPASNVPGAYLFFSIFIATTELNPITFMCYYPLIAASVFLILLYVTASKLTSSNLAILAPFIYTGFAYNRAFFVTPGDLNYFFYVLFIFFFSLMLEKDEIRFKIILLMLVVSITITHALGSPLLLVFSLLPFIPLLKNWKTKRSLVLAIFVFIVWVSWLVYSAQGSFKYIITLLHDTVVGKGELLLPITSSLSGIRFVPLLIKYGISAFLILSGVLIAVLYFIDAKQLLERRRIIVIGGAFMSCYLLLVFLLPLSSEPFIRLYSISVIFYAILVPLYLSKTRIVKVNLRLNKSWLKQLISYSLVVATVVLLLIIPITKYDNNPGFYYPSSSLQGATFAVEHLNGNVVWIRNHLQLIDFAASTQGILLEGYMDVQQNVNVTFTSLAPYPFYYGQVSSMFNSSQVKSCDAIIFNDYEDASMIMSGFTGYEEARISYENNISQTFNAVYSSGTLRIYSHSP